MLSLAASGSGSPAHEITDTSATAAKSTRTTTVTSTTNAAPDPESTAVAPSQNFTSEGQSPPEKERQTLPEDKEHFAAKLSADDSTEEATSPPAEKDNSQGRWSNGGS